MMLWSIISCKCFKTNICLLNNSMCVLSTFLMHFKFIHSLFVCVSSLAFRTLNTSSPGVWWPYNNTTRANSCTNWRPIAANGWSDSGDDGHKQRWIRFVGRVFLAWSRAKGEKCEWTLNMILLLNKCIKNSPFLVFRSKLLKFIIKSSTKPFQSH